MKKVKTQSKKILELKRSLQDWDYDQRVKEVWHCIEAWTSEG